MGLPRQSSGRVPQFDMFGASTTTVSGFRDHVQLGASGLISMSREVVATVGLEIDGLALTQPVARHFRGAVLDAYTPGGKWVRSEALRTFDRARVLSFGRGDDHGSQLDRGSEELPPLEGEWNEGRFPPGLVVIDQTYELVNKTSPNLFAIGSPIQVAYRSQSAIYMNPIDRTLTLPGKPLRQVYRVRSATNYSRPAIAEELAAYRAMRDEAEDPFADGRLGRELRSIAQRLMQEAGLTRDFDAPPSREDERIVRLFERHLSDNYAYTLEMIAPESATDDPTLYFLNDSRRGHCEYFASALAGLCRSVGIEARVVTGFVSSEIDEDTGRYVIRQSNAHAWVEAPVLDEVAFRVSDDPEQPLTRETRLLWKTFDPSPMNDVGEGGGGTSALVQTLRSWMFAVEDLWVNTVVGYDAQAQQELIGVSGDDQVGRLSEWVDRVTAPSTGALSGTPLWVRRLIPPGLAIAGCVMIAIAFRRLGGDLPARRRRAVDRRTQRAVSRIDRALKRMGCARPEHRTLLDHAVTIGDAGGDALARVARALYAERFGGRRTEHASFTDALDTLERLAAGRGRA
ncbi:MAG: hypothetical protein Tsb0013_25120 [Phycisphaerales bacterium]